MNMEPKMSIQWPAKTHYESEITEAQSAYAEGFDTALELCKQAHQDFINSQSQVSESNAQPSQVSGKVDLHDEITAVENVIYKYGNVLDDCGVIYTSEASLDIVRMIKSKFKPVAEKEELDENLVFHEVLGFFPDYPEGQSREDENRADRIAKAICAKFKPVNVPSVEEIEEELESKHIILDESSHLVSEIRKSLAQAIHRLLIGGEKK